MRSDLLDPNAPPTQALPQGVAPAKPKAAPDPFGVAALGGLPSHPVTDPLAFAELPPPPVSQQPPPLGAPTAPSAPPSPQAPGTPFVPTYTPPSPPPTPPAPYAPPVPAPPGNVPPPPSMPGPVPVPQPSAPFVPPPVLPEGVSMYTGGMANAQESSNTDLMNHVDQSIGANQGAGVFDRDSAQTVHSGDANFADALARMDPSRYEAYAKAGVPGFTVGGAAASTANRQKSFPIANGVWSDPATDPMTEAPNGTPFSSGIQPYTGGTANVRESDAPQIPNTGAGPLQLGGGASPQATPFAPAPVGGGSSTSGNAPINTGNPLTAQQLQVGPLADRFAIAQQKLDAFRKANDPKFQADLRDANRMAARGGALGSGALQSSIGDVVSNRANTESSQGMQYLADALSGTIGDEFAKTGIDQQQQGFQAGRQDQAFGESVVLKQLLEALTQGQHNRSVDTLQAGNTGDPTNLLTMLSQIFGGQSSAAGQSLAELIKGMSAKPTTGGGTLEELLRVLKGGTPAGSPVPDVGTV